MPICVFVPCRTVSSAPSERARDFAPTVRSGRKGPFRSRPRRSPIGRLASGASASRSGPFRAGASAAGAKSRAVGAGAFGRSVVVRACHRAARPAWGAPRIRRMRAIRPRRNTAFAAWPRPGGADVRPAVREALGRASAPVQPLRAEGTTFGFPYGASLALAPTLRRRSAAVVYGPPGSRIAPNGRARYP